MRRRVALVAFAVLGLFATAGAARADVGVDTSAVNAASNKQDLCVYPMRRTNNAICVNLPDRLPIPPLF